MPLPQVLSEVTFRGPRLPVLSNVTAQPFPSCPASHLGPGGPGAAAGDPRDIPALLSRQLVEPVGGVRVYKATTCLNTHVGGG